MLGLTVIRKLIKSSDLQSTSIFFGVLVKSWGQFPDFTTINGSVVKFSAYLSVGYAIYVTPKMRANEHCDKARLIVRAS